MIIRLISWGIEKPYMHVHCIDLTAKQHDKFHRIQNYESMTEAYEYAIKIGEILYKI